MGKKIDVLLFFYPLCYTQLVILEKDRNLLGASDERTSKECLFYTSQWIQKTDVVGMELEIPQAGQIIDEPIANFLWL